MQHTDASMPEPGPSLPGSRYELNVRILRFWTRPGREAPAPLARELLASGRVVDAVEIAEAALERSPANAELLQIAGEARMQRGHPERGRDLLRAAAAQSGTPTPDPGEPARVPAESSTGLEPAVTSPPEPLAGVRVHRSVRIDDRLPEDAELDRLLDELDVRPVDHAG